MIERLGDRSRRPRCAHTDGRSWIQSASINSDELTLEHLDRWVLSGAHWRVVDISTRHVVVDLCACTGEPVERRHSDNPVVIAYLRTASSHLDEVTGP